MTFSRSAPVNPWVAADAATRARSTSGSQGTRRACTARMAARPAASGAGTCTRRSKRPGRSSAGSSADTRLVAPMTRMEADAAGLCARSRPSMQVSSWHSACSRSSQLPRCGEPHKAQRQPAPRNHVHMAHRQQQRHTSAGAVAPPPHTHIPSRARCYAYANGHNTCSTARTWVAAGTKRPGVPQGRVAAVHTEAKKPSTATCRRQTRKGRTHSDTVRRMWCGLNMHHHHAPHRAAPRLCHRIYFVNEHHTRRARARAVEQGPHPRRAAPHQHLHKVTGGAVQERHAGLARHCPRQQSLPRAAGPVQEHATGAPGTHRPAGRAQSGHGSTTGAGWPSLAKGVGARTTSTHFTHATVRAQVGEEARWASTKELRAHTLHPTPHTAPQPHSPTAPQPHSPTAPQPHSPTAPQPHSPTAPQPHSPTTPQHTESAAAPAGPPSTPAVPAWRRPPRPRQQR
jgi:hypothetical protein